MPLKELVEKRNELEAKQKKLREILNEGFAAGEKDSTGKPMLRLQDIKSVQGDTAAKAGYIRARNEELTALEKEVADLAATESAADAVKQAGQRVVINDDETGQKVRFVAIDPNNPDMLRMLQGSGKSLGEMITEESEFKSMEPRSKNKRVTFVLKGGLQALLKTTFETGAGWAPENLRIGRVIEEALRPIQVIDTIPGGQTTQAAIVYMEETTVTDAAAARSEAGAYAESTLALTEQTSNVRSIGTSLPVTDEQLEDVPAVRSYLNMRLPFLVRRKLDSYLLTGTGVAPQLTGINSWSGIQTQAKGSDPVPDAIYKAMTLVRVTGRANPNVVYLHDNDWQSIRLLRTADGIYIWGNPSEAGPMRIWGLPVVVTDAQTENTGLVVDTTFSQLFMRRDVTVEIGLDTADFTNGIQTVRCGLRAAFVAYRGAAAAKVTGI